MSNAEKVRQIRREAALTVVKRVAEFLNEYADMLEAHDKSKPVAWQFLNHDGEWVNGSEHNRHYENTVEAGYQTRQLYPGPPTTSTGAPQEQTYTWRSRHSESEDWIYHNGERNLWDNQKLLKQAPVVDERVEFEKWAGGPPVGHDCKATDEIAFWCWEAWQARAKLGQAHPANKFNYPRSPVKLVFDDGVEVAYVRCDSCGHFRSPDHSCDGCEIATLKAKLGQTTDKACSAVVPDETTRARIEYRIKNNSIIKDGHAKEFDK